MALESPTFPEHAGMELSRLGGIWLSKSCMLGLGCTYTLFALTSCGLWHPPVAVLSPLLYPTGFGDAAATLGWVVLAGPGGDAAELSLTPSTAGALHLQDLALHHITHGI